jgi:hypothetical protein
MNELAGARHDGLPSPPRGALPLAAVIAVGVAATLLTWLIVLLTENEKDFSNQSANGPAARRGTPIPKFASEDQLRALARLLDHPIYWTGPRPGFNYEVTQTADGKVLIRYVPRGNKVGVRAFAYRFVGTYPYPDAYATLREAARMPGAVTRKLAGGGLAVANSRGAEIVRVTAVALPSPPVFFARPRSKLLVETFDLPLKRALRLVASGQVRPIR